MYKRHLYSVFIFLLVQSFAFGGNPVKIKAGWRKGEVRKYLVTHTIEATSIPMSFTYEKIIKILDSTAEGYIIQMESERAVLDTESRKTDDGIASMFLNMTQGIPIKVQTDQYGSVKAILNMSEVSGYLTKRMKRFYMAIGGEFPDTSNMQKIDSALSNSSLIQQQLQEIKNEIDEFFHIYGLELEMNSTIKSGEQFSNFFAERIISGVSSISFGKTSPSGTWQITIHDVPDKKQVTNIMKKSMEKESDPESKSKFAKLKIEITEDAIYDLDPSEMWINRFSFISKTVMSSGNTKDHDENLTDRIEYKLID